MSNERLTRLQLILSLNLLVWCFLWSQGNNDTLIHYPFITVVQRESPNNTLQIRPPSYNSFCHSQYIIWKTHSTLSSGHGLRIIVGDTFRVKPKSGAFFSGIKQNYPDLSVIAKSTASHSRPKERWNRFLLASLNEKACKFMLMRLFCYPGSPLQA